MIRVNSNSARVQHMVYILALCFFEKFELAYDFITYITTTSLYTKNIQPSREVKTEVHMQYLQGWNVCICYVFLCGYILYMYIVRQFLVLQKRGLLSACI